MLDVTTHHGFVPLAPVPTVIADALVTSAGTPSRVTVNSMYFMNTNAATCKATGVVLVQARYPCQPVERSLAPVTKNLPGTKDKKFIHTLMISVFPLQCVP